MEKKSIQEHRINQIFVAQLYSQAIPSSECPLCVRWQTSPPQLWAESCAPKTEGPQNRGPLPTLGTLNGTVLRNGVFAGTTVLRGGRWGGP